MFRCVIMTLGVAIPIAACSGAREQSSTTTAFDAGSAPMDTPAPEQPSECTMRGGSCLDQDPPFQKGPPPTECRAIGQEETPFACPEKHVCCMYRSEPPKCAPSPPATCGTEFAAAPIPTDPNVFGQRIGSRSPGSWIMCTPGLFGPADAIALSLSGLPEPGIDDGRNVFPFRLYVRGADCTLTNPPGTVGDAYSGFIEFQAAGPVARIVMVGHAPLGSGPLSFDASGLRMRITGLGDLVRVEE